MAIYNMYSYVWLSLLMGMEMDWEEKIYIENNI